MIAICPSCKKKRKLMNSFSIKSDDILSVIETEKACCKKCLEDHFWFMHNKAKKELNQV